MFRVDTKAEPKRNSNLLAAVAAWGPRVGAPRIRGAARRIDEIEMRRIHGGLSSEQLATRCLRWNATWLLEPGLSSELRRKNGQPVAGQPCLSGDSKHVTANKLTTSSRSWMNRGGSSRTKRRRRKREEWGSFRYARLLTRGVDCERRKNARYTPIDSSPDVKGSTQQGDDGRRDGATRRSAAARARNSPPIAQAQRLPNIVAIVIINLSQLFFPELIVVGVL